jgi:hypothetical protein
MSVAFSECSSYRNYEEEARALVQGVLEKSLHLCKQELARYTIEWPTGDALTVEGAKKAIDELVKVKEVHNEARAPLRYAFESSHRLGESESLGYTASTSFTKMGIYTASL